MKRLAQKLIWIILIIAISIPLMAPRSAWGVKKVSDPIPTEATP